MIRTRAGLVLGVNALAKAVNLAGKVAMASATSAGAARTDPQADPVITVETEGTTVRRRRGRRWTDPGGRRRWVVVVVAGVSLAVGGLLGTALGPGGLVVPWGVVRPEPIAAGHEPVWSGRMRHGVVPVGWAHSKAGAAAAATSYTIVLSSELLFDPAKRRLAVSTIAAPEARARLQRELDATAEMVAAGLTGGKGAVGAGRALDPSKVVFQAIPVRYRVELYDGTRARIAIWMTGVGGYEDSHLPVQEAWGTTTVQLRWAEGDWKETGAAVADGPTPAAGQAPPTPARVIVNQAQRFKEYRAGPAP